MPAVPPGDSGTVLWDDEQWWAAEPGGAARTGRLRGCTQLSPWLRVGSAGNSV